MDKAFVRCVSALFNNTHLTLHALGSASTGARVRSLGGLLLTLVLQFELLGVHTLHASWTLQLLVWLLNTLKENSTTVTVNTAH